LQGRKCAQTGARLWKTSEVDHQVPLFKVWREHRDMAWPALLAFWGLPNLQIINRDVHVHKCAAEATSRRRIVEGCRSRRLGDHRVGAAQADDCSSAKTTDRDRLHDHESVAERRRRDEAADQQPDAAEHQSTLSAMIAFTAVSGMFSRRSHEGDQPHIGNEQQTRLPHQRHRQCKHPGEQVRAGDHQQSGCAACGRVGEQGETKKIVLAKHAWLLLLVSRRITAPVAQLGARLPFVD